MKHKPSIFIGSSSEAISLARGISAELAKDFETQLWDDRLFELGEDTLRGLLRAVLAFDYAVLVVSDDDTLLSHRNPSKALPKWWHKWLPQTQHRYASPRDNVVFELGLFMGAMGRRRAFAIVAPGKRGSPKIPSDLFGNNMVYLRSETVETEDSSRIEKDLTQLVTTIRERFENESEFELLPSTGSAVSYFHNFALPVCVHLSGMDTVEIGSRQYRISGDNFRFKVVIPGSLTEANRPYAAQMFGRMPVEEFTIKTVHRPFPFWVSTSIDNGNLIFWDYPTILKSSDEAVEFVTKSAFLSNPTIRKRFETKELHNFEKSLRLLLQTSEASTIKNNVEIVPSSAI